MKTIVNIVYPLPYNNGGDAFMIAPKALISVHEGNKAKQTEYGGKEYAYFTNLDVKAGDLVVAKSKHGFDIVQVVGVSNPDQAKYANAWLVSKVDQEAHKELIDNEQSRHDMRLRIAQRRIELIEEAELATLAKEDETLADLVAELNAIGKD